MAIGDTKKDVKLGKTRYENLKNTDDNFASLFDTVDDLNTAIDGKEPKFTKNTAFNVNFNDVDGNLSMDGTRFAGTLNSVARADHRHPTDTTRLAAKPDGSNLLIESNKINTAYLPDSILGQLYYKGVWAPSSGGTSPTSPDAATTEPHRGDYYIAGDSGNYNPEQERVSGVSYSTGDWAVYNGNSWDKVDNTDAVTMVNGQIGAVKTYKGDYDGSTIYYCGDIVKYTDDCLYLCIIASGTSGVAPSNTTNWKIFGKIYSNATTTASGLMSSDDKTKLNGISAGAEVNQYAYSQINIGSTQIKATTKTDTFTLTAGTNVTLTSDTANKKVTITSKDTVYTHPTTDGNKHVPANGTTNGGKYLRASSTAGSYSWETPKIGKVLTKTFTSANFSKATGSLYLYDPGLSPDAYSILRVYKTDAADKYLEADVMISVDLSGDTHKYFIYTDEKFDGMIEYISHIVS